MHTAVLASGPFVAWGPSHRVVLVLAALGVAALVLLGRWGDPRLVRRTSVVLAAAVVLPNLGYELWFFDPANPLGTLPLELSDLAPYAAGVALLTGRRWAGGLTYYWCLTLTVQALATPALTGPDFPDPIFLVFFANHVTPVWAAVFLLAAHGFRPGWHDYRRTLAVTAAWAVVAQTVNLLGGANFGYLARKPATASILDLLGPWPAYLLVEAVIVLVVWAALTAPWTRHGPAPDDLVELPTTREPRVRRVRTG